MDALFSTHFLELKKFLLKNVFAHHFMLFSLPSHHLSLLIAFHFPLSQLPLHAVPLAFALLHNIYINIYIYFFCSLAMKMPFEYVLQIA